MWGIQVFLFLITRGGEVIRMMVRYIFAQIRTGVGLIPWDLVQAHVSSFARFFN